MDDKKSSRTKRGKVESTNKKMKSVKQDQVEDKKPGEKCLNEKCKKKVHVENTESKKKVQTKDISLLNVNENKTINPVDKVLEAIPSSHKSNEKVQEFSNEQSNKKKKKKIKYKMLVIDDEDKNINNSDNVFEAKPSRWPAVKSKDQNLLSNESFDKKQHYNKNGGKYSNNGISDKDSIDYNSKPNRVHDRKKYNLPENGESVLEEIDEDIFTLPNEYSLAHCVAEDLRMGAGIAVDFKKKFGGVGKLIDQDLKLGDVGVVKHLEQYAFYLITKKISHGKPTMASMEKALCSLLRKMKELNLTKLAIPKIGCGLDGLNWSYVTLLINQIFSGSGIHITVCVPSKILNSKALLPRICIYNTPRNLWELEHQTHIILFICLKNCYKKSWTSDAVDKVDAKYPFKDNLLKDVKNNKMFNPGDIKIYKVDNEVIICIFTTQTAYYSSVEKGFKNLKLQTTNHYKFMALQSGPTELRDNFQHTLWIVLIWRSIFTNSELWLCGDPKQKHHTFFNLSMNKPICN